MSHNQFGLFIIFCIVSSTLWANELTQRKFNIMMNKGSADVKIKESKCVLNKHRKEYTEKEWAAKDRTTCYYLEIENAHIEFRDGRKEGPVKIKTQPMFYGITPNVKVLSDMIAEKSCIQGIASALKRKMNGQSLYQYPENHPSAGKSYERFKAPELIGVGLDENGFLITETAPGKISGQWKQTFSYNKVINTQGGDIPEGKIDYCSVSSFEQKHKIVDKAFNQVTDEDATTVDHITNAGRNVGKAIGRVWEGAGQGIRRFGQSLSQ